MPLYGVQALQTPESGQIGIGRCGRAAGWEYGFLPSQTHKGSQCKLIHPLGAVEPLPLGMVKEIVVIRAGAALFISKQEPEGLAW